MSSVSSISNTTINTSAEVNELLRGMSGAVKILYREEISNDLYKVVRDKSGVICIYRAKCGLCEDDAVLCISEALYCESCMHLSCNDDIPHNCEKSHLFAKSQDALYSLCLECKECFVDKPSCLCNSCVIDRYTLSKENPRGTFVCDHCDGMTTDRYKWIHGASCGDCPELSLEEVLEEERLMEHERIMEDISVRYYAWLEENERIRNINRDYIPKIPPLFKIEKLSNFQREEETCPDCGGHENPDYLAYYDVCRECNDDDSD